MGIRVPIHSSYIDVRSGVPQGSMFGPLLFLIFVSLLPTYVISKCKFFADDLKIYDTLILSTCHQIYLVVKEILIVLLM